MNRAVCLFLALAFALTACGGGPSGFTDPPAAANVSGLSRSIQGVVTNVRVPIELTVFIPCANAGNGELVNLFGNLHEVFTITINANNVHIDQLFNPQGISGTGSATGAKYQGTGVTRSDINLANTGFPLTAQNINNFRIVGQGTGNNLLIHDNNQFTVNANGQVTVNRDNFTTQCK